MNANVYKKEIDKCNCCLRVDIDRAHYTMTFYHRECVFSCTFQNSKEYFNQGGNSYWKTAKPSLKETLS